MTGSGSDSSYHPVVSHLEALRPALETRHRVLQAIRDFFITREFIEVETPSRVLWPALELHIDAEPSGDHFLRTSPELHMKKLLASGYERIFQMGPCFRRGERGRLHHPEYTLLEWYRADADYMDILADTKALLTHIAREVLGTTDIRYQGRTIALWPIWEQMTVTQAFRQYAGWDLSAGFDAERFDLDLVDRVEPGLPRDVPVILLDYPHEVGALARQKPGDPRVVERWELYVAGLELANAYSELTDAEEQRRRFEACAKERKMLGKEVYPLDKEFLQLLDHMPPSGGVALGVDRLVMLLTDSSSLDEVIPFRE